MDIQPTGGRMDFWDAETAELQFMVVDQFGLVTALAFSHDSRLLAIAGAEPSSGRGQVHIWERTADVKVRTLARHSGPVLSVAFSPAGNYLASAGGLGENLVHLW